jgi:hypothetical protein
MAEAEDSHELRPYGTRRASRHPHSA